jgi:hypothetical protein
MRTLTTMPRAVCSLLWIVAATLGAGDVPMTVRPLAMSGAGLEAVDHALIRLARGDTSAVEALPVEAFLDPVARPDAQHDGLARRWTMALPVALARLDPVARAHALTRLNARYQTLAGDRRGSERARLASAFLPAPDALKDLQRAGDRAFDLGRFDDFLGMTYLLAAGGQNADDPRRQQVALQLSGLGPQVDASLRLPSPGTPVPSAGNGVMVRGHLAMRWVVVPGWVLACDPFGEVVWQYRVDRLAQVTTGPGAVMVRDSTGLRAVTDDGSVTILPPLPSGAAVLTIAGGAAWFATGERAWRLVLADGSIHALDLAAPPLGAPVVRGSQSLWLTARDLLLFDGDRLIHRFQHGLPASSGWRLGVDGERPLVLAEDQRSWRLESIAEQLARLHGNAKATLLLQARRIDEALAVLGEPADDEARHLALRAHLMRGPAAVASQRERLLAWATTAQDRALVAVAEMPQVPRDFWLENRLTPGTQPPANYRLLDECAAGDPAIRLTTQIMELGDDPTTWDHLFTGAAWTRWRTSRGRPVFHGAGPRVVEPSEPAPANAVEPQRNGDGTWQAGEQVIRLERSIDRLAIICHGRDGALLWRQQWRPADYLAAPSQTIDVREDDVLVSEGGQRLSAFAREHGRLRVRFSADELGSGTPYVISGRLAVIGPLGIDTTLTVIDALQQRTMITLPSPKRWALPFWDQLLVVMHDGSARLYPGGKEVTLPRELTQSRQAPLMTNDGLVLDGRLWRWQR